MTTTSRETSFLPDGMAAFFRRRFVEIAAVIIGLIAIFLAVAFVSYSPTDPSFNNATNIPPANWLGFPGAQVADIALQGLGITCWLIVPVLASWAWRIGSHQGLRNGWIRLGIFVLTLLMAATAVTMRGANMQAAGAVDRESVYTKNTGIHAILNILFVVDF